MSTVYPIILCGGSGTRLWPLSRKSYPKQFVAADGRQQPVPGLRAAPGVGRAEMDFARPVIVTNADFRFIVTEQLAEIGHRPGRRS